MAEAFLHHYAGDRFEVLSAGLVPTQVHPLTRQVLTETGLDPSRLRAKGPQRRSRPGPHPLAIIVCDQAEEDCPHLLSIRAPDPLLAVKTTLPKRKGPRRSSCASSARSGTRLRTACVPGSSRWRTAPNTHSPYDSR